LCFGNRDNGGLLLFAFTKIPIHSRLPNIYSGILFTSPPLVKRLSYAFGVSKKSYLMLEFARLHFPETLAEMESKYNEVYTKRHEWITERLTTLKGGGSGSGITSTVNGKNSASYFFHEHQASKK
jgi:hypothetical protein